MNIKPIKRIHQSQRCDNMPFGTHLLLAILILLSLSACEFETPTPTEEPAEDVVLETEVPTEVPATEEPVETEVPTEAPTELLPAEEPITCVELLTPKNGIEVYYTGKVTFTWTALEGADSYLLTFTLPSGDEVIFETDGTICDRYMEAFAQAGKYQWNVIALAMDGNQVCSSDSFTFIKPAPESAPQGDDSGDSGGGGWADDDGNGN